MRVDRLEIRDLRNIRSMQAQLDPGLNVFCGRNAQGKTSILEAVGLLARGRSFRTEETRTLIRRGEERLLTRASWEDEQRESAQSLQVEINTEGRRLLLDDQEVRPAEYYGRLEVAVYSTDRLRVIRGTMRERRQFVDRGAAALWPTYRRSLRDYERVLQQRNAALESGDRSLATWDERLVETGAVLRQRRQRYVERLSEIVGRLSESSNESYTVAVDPAHADESAHQQHLSDQVERSRVAEQRRGRSLVGPHRDRIVLGVDGHEASRASSGQARSLLLALTIASQELYRQERGSAAVLLLDDLDSELDDERAHQVCSEALRRGQALVTTAHPSWARELANQGRLFEVHEGQLSHA